MNPIFVNKYLHFGEQDSKKTVLFLFFILLPVAALLPHAHALCALFCVLLFALGIRDRGWSTLLFSGRARQFLLFLTLCLSGLVLPAARGATLLSVLLRLSFFLPLLFGEYERTFRRILSFVGGVIGVLAVSEVLLGFGKEGYADASLFASLSRAGGVFGNPNILAAFLLTPAIFALSDALFEKNPALPLICFCGAASGIAASYSRGALLALFASATLLLVRRFGVWRVFFTVLALLPLTTLLLPEALTARLLSMVSPDTSVSYRFSLWKSILRLSPHTLLFGVGEGREALLSALSPVLASGLLQVEHTHSLYFHLLVSMGIPGVIFFLLLCVRALLRGKSRGARAALLSLLIFGIFDDPLYSGQTEVIFWLTLGLC